MRLLEAVFVPTLLAAWLFGCDDSASPDDAGRPADAQTRDAAPDAARDAGPDLGADASTSDGAPADASEPDASLPDASSADADSPDGAAGNRAPVANAGLDRNDWLNDRVRLDGTQSSDPDGDSLSFLWTQIAGESVALEGATTATCSFSTNSAGDRSFRLTVSDGTLTSTDAVTISVDAYAGGRVTVLRNPLQFAANLTNGYGVTNVGTLLFVADGSAGLRVFDVSDPSNMRLLGTRNTAGTAFGVDVAGTYAFVADNTNGLVIMDVADFVNNVASPAAPTIVQTATTSYGAWGVEVVGNYAFVADGGTNAGTIGGGLQIFDVTDYVSGASNPGPARIVGFVPTPGNAVAVDVHGDHAFIADRGTNAAGTNSGVRVIDVGDFVAGVSPPTAPTLIGSWPTSGANVFNLLATDDYVYVSDYGSNVEAIDGALRILDVRDPTNPVEVVSAATDTMGSPNGLALSGDHLFITTPYNLEVLDVGDFVAGSVSPAPPISVKIYGSPAINIQDVLVLGDYAFTVASAGAELAAINVSDLSSDPSLIGTYREPNAINSQSAFAALALTGDYAVVGQSRSASLQVLDLSDPTNPSPALANAVNVGDAIGHIVISGDHAYLAAGTLGVVVADISEFVAGVANPVPPVVVGSFDLPGFDSPQQHSISGGYLHVPWGGAGYQLLELTDPTMPLAPTGGTTGRFDIAGVAFDAEVRSGIAYVAHGAQGLQVLDLSDPATPTFMAQLTAPDATSVVLDEPRVYVAGQRLTVGDVSNPTSPTAIGSINTRFGFLVLDAGRLYANKGGPVEIDISDPSYPYLRSGYTLQNSGGEFVRRSSFIYACDGQAGFHVLRTFSDAVLVAPTSGSVGATAQAILSWPAELKDTMVRCLVSGGECTVTNLDRVGNRATVEWSLPTALGDYELVGVVGDYNQWLSDRVKTRVQ